MPQAFNNLIRFPLTQDFIDYWSQTSIANLIKDGFLDLRIRRDDYSVVTKGEGITTERGYQATYGMKQTKYLGFRCRVREQKEDLYLALIELANYTAGENCEIVAIEVHDYHYRHDRTDRDRGYRIRRGVFEGEFSQVSGTATEGYIDCEGAENITGNRYSSGFSFKFMEISTSKYF